MTWSVICSCCTDIDRTMEEKFIECSKSHRGARGAGILGITRNHGAYQRWVLPTRERFHYLAATFSIADMQNDPSNAQKNFSNLISRKATSIYGFTSFHDPFDATTDRV